MALEPPTVPREWQLIEQNCSNHAMSSERKQIMLCTDSSTICVFPCCSTLATFLGPRAPSVSLSMSQSSPRNKSLVRSSSAQRCHYHQTKSDFNCSKQLSFPLLCWPVVVVLLVRHKDNLRWEAHEKLGSGLTSGHAGQLSRTSVAGPASPSQNSSRLAPARGLAGQAYLRSVWKCARPAGK